MTQYVIKAVQYIWFVMFLMTVMILLCSLRISNIFQEPVQFVVKHFTDVLSRCILAFYIDGFNLHIYQRQSVALSGFAFFFAQFWEFLT